MEDWIIGILCLTVLALFVIGSLWLAIRRRRDLERQVKAWPELARRTGLTYTPASGSQQGYSMYENPAGVRGEYRGRYLSIDLIVMGDIEGRTSFPAFQNTSISLNVQNRARFSLAIHAKRGLTRLYTSNNFSSGNRDFDRCFSVKGWPRRYVQIAVRLIVRRYQRLLGWMIRNGPSIKLKGADLFCWQNGELTDVDDQLALLNLLCDLAELTEVLGSEALNAAKQGKSRGQRRPAAVKPRR